MSEVEETNAGETEKKRGKVKRDRSPSFPFISLREAIEKAKKFSEEYKRHPARVSNAVGVWGYSAKSSGGIQTIAALKSFGLLDDEGSGDERKVALSDLAWRILEGYQESTRSQAIVEAAFKPSIISEYWGKWGIDRPPDAECLDHLVFDKKFNRASAKRFLEIFDETLSYADLIKSDIISGDDQGNMPTETLPTHRKGRRKMETGQWAKEFAWPLSDGTTAELVISGMRPGMDEIEILKTNFEIAKRVLEKIAQQSQKQSETEELQE